MNKSLITLGILLLFLVGVMSFVSSATYQSDKELNLKIPTNESGCFITVSYPNSTIFIQEQPMQENIGYANYTIDSTLVSTFGEYTAYTNCSTVTFLVTQSGEPKDLTQLLTRIFLILFLLTLIIFIQVSDKRINYDQWYNKIHQKYQTKNWVKFSLAAVGYNMMKNSYIFSYLAGLLGLLILTDLVVFFNITAAIEVMKIVFGIYAWSAILVSLIFFSQVQEWITEWVKDLQDINWGEVTSPK